MCDYTYYYITMSAKNIIKKLDLFLEYVTPGIQYLKKYLEDVTGELTDSQREEIINIIPDIVHTYISLYVEDDVIDKIVTDWNEYGHGYSVYDIREIDPDDLLGVLLEDYPDLYDDLKYRHLDNLIDSHMTNEIPTWYFYDKGEVIKKMWLVHFTSHDPKTIAEEGFRYGGNVHNLGLTDRPGEFDSYNYDENDPNNNIGFAYNPNRIDLRSLGEIGNPYGRNAVIFVASGYESYNKTDGEYHVMFDINTARNRIPVYHETNRTKGTSVVSIKNKNNGNTIYEAENIADVYNWIKKNFAQYYNVIAYGIG